MFTYFSEFLSRQSKKRFFMQKSKILGNFFFDNKISIFGRKFFFRQKFPFFEKYSFFLDKISFFLEKISFFFWKKLFCFGKKSVFLEQKFCFFLEKNSVFFGKKFCFFGKNWQKFLSLDKKLFFDEISLLIKICEKGFSRNLYGNNQ